MSALERDKRGEGRDAEKKAASTTTTIVDGRENKTLVHCLSEAVALGCANTLGKGKGKASEAVKFLFFVS
jgi:hypothetical protein